MNIRKIDTGLYVQESRYDIERVRTDGDSEFYIRDSKDDSIVLGPLTLDEAIKWAAEHNQEGGS